MHHCDFTDSCIGFDNQRHFVRFLLYAAISSIYTTCLMVARVTRLENKASTELVPHHHSIVSLLVPMLAAANGTFVYVSGG